MPLDMSELAKEINEILGNVVILPVGELDATRGKVYDIWVEYTAPYMPGIIALKWKHYAKDPEYCQIAQQSGASWLYKFEDGDENLPTLIKEFFKPDWDYDEPILLVEKINDKIRITIQEYGGVTWARIGCGTKVLWDKVGSSERIGVGEVKELDNPSMVGQEEPGAQAKMPWWGWAVIGGAGAGVVLAIAKGRGK